MGVYRTVIASFTCPRCGESFSADVQFKTGDDREMQTYAEGDVASDLAPDTHEGITDGWCRRCTLVLQSEVNALMFRFLRSAVEERRVRLWRARWNYNYETRMLEVVRADAAELSVDEVDHAAAVPQTDPYNLNYRQFFFDHEVWDGAARLNPSPDSPQSTTWHDELHEAVERNLPSGGSGSPDVDVDVVVDAERRVFVKRETLRPA